MDTASSPARISFSDLAALVLDLYSFSEEAIRGCENSARLNECRAVLAYLARHDADASYGVIETFLNRTSMPHRVAGFDERIRKDDDDGLRLNRILITIRKRYQHQESPFD